MPFIIKALIVFPLFYFLVGRDFFRLWKAGLLGPGIALLADYTGDRLNFYHYRKGIITLDGWLPLLNFINIYLFSIIFLHWLPRSWTRRIMYIICFSFLFLFIEAILYKSGAIIYPNWALWKSFFLDITGLSILAHLSDMVLQKTHE